MISLFNESHFRGLPVITQHGPLIEQYLERTYDTLYRTVAQHGKLFAIRIDLRFPRHYWPLEGQMLGNDFLTRFKNLLQSRIENSQSVAATRGTRVHPANLRCIWAREYDQGGGKPHFHVLILLNGHAYRSLGKFDPNGQNMMSRILEAWAAALGLACIDTRGLVHVPNNAQYHVDLRDADSMRELFYRASYLCKAWSKDFADGCHPFGASRT